MSQTDSAHRQDLLDSLAEVADELAHALAWLTDAFDQLDDQQADRLEEQLFRPVRSAYGRARRTHTEFAARHGLPAQRFDTPQPGAPSTGVKGFVTHAADAVSRAEVGLVALQDSLLPIEFGDQELRAGLTEVRELIDGLPQRATAFLRTFGR